MDHLRQLKKLNQNKSNYPGVVSFTHTACIRTTDVCTWLDFEKHLVRSGVVAKQLSAPVLEHCAKTLYFGIVLYNQLFLLKIHVELHLLYKNCTLGIHFLHLLS